MMSEAQVWESNALQSMQLASEARGLKFYRNPPREMVPEFLGDFRPDAIALGPDGGIIIELKHRRSSASDKQLAAIARRISDHKGWEFRVIYLNPPMVETPPIEKPTQEQLQATFREIEALAQGGHSAAALVTAWAALESLARLASDYDAAEQPRSFSPVQAVQRLAEEGYLEHDTANHLREMVKLRNAVVHGDLSVNVAPGQVESLLKELRVIASAIASVKPGDDA